MGVKIEIWLEEINPDKYTELGRFDIDWPYPFLPSKGDRIDPFSFISEQEKEKILSYPIEKLLTEDGKKAFERDVTYCKQYFKKDHTILDFIRNDSGDCIIDYLSFGKICTDTPHIYMKLEPRS